MNLILLAITILFVWNGLFLQSVECIRKRIVEGETDWLNLYNYQVSIQVKRRRTGLYEHGCGGSIINEEFILTAAHCFISKNGTILNVSGDRVKILAGTSELNSGGILVNIDKVIVYKGYKHVNHVAVGDIALIKLRYKLDVRNDRRLAKVKPPKKLYYDDYVGKKAIVSGFGVWKFESDRGENGIPTTKPVLSNNRRYLTVTIISKDNCTACNDIICSTLEQKDHHFFVRGVCNGDSGGPLVYMKTIIGIVSRAATNCDMRTKTAKYTRVASYMDFITRVVNDVNNKSDMIILNNN